MEEADLRAKGRDNVANAGEGGENTPRAGATLASMSRFSSRASSCFSAGCTSFRRVPSIRTRWPS